MAFLAGKEPIEAKIQEEISPLNKAIDNQRSEPFDINELLTQAKCNIITTVAMDKKCDYSDEKIKKMQMADYIRAQIIFTMCPLLKVGMKIKLLI